MKSILITVAFVYGSETFVIFSYLAVFLISIFYYLRVIEFYELRMPFANAVRPLRVIIRRAVRDASVQFLSALNAAVFLIDKQVLALAGIDVLFYIYIAKFVNFSMSLNTVLLQRWQIETRAEGRERTLMRTISRTGVFFVLAFAAYNSMFLVAFSHLPASELTEFSEAIFLAGMGLMAIQMLRDAGSRWFYMNDLYKFVGYVVSSTLAVYILGVIVIQKFSPFEMIVFLSCMHLTAFLIYLVIWSRVR